MTTTIHIRKMTVSDIDEVRIIGSQAAELKASDTDEFWNTATLTRWIEANQDVLLVAEADGKVVGFHLTQLHVPSSSAYLSEIAVHPDYRRQGIAHQLIEETLERLKAHGIVYVYGLTHLDNKKIHALLETFGFKKGEAFYWFERYLPVA